MSNWNPTCVLCELLNSYRSVREAATQFQGIPVCGEHLREVKLSETSNAAKAIRSLLDNTGRQ